MPIDRTRRIKVSPYAPSRSRIRYRGICSQPQASVRLIGDPCGRWMFSNSEPQKLPPAMPHNQQAIEQPKRDCRHHEQVHRGNPISMGTKERPPSLRGRDPPPHHIFGHAGLADIDAKLQKLAMDPRCSPQRIGAAHLADKLAYFYRHGRSPAAVLRFPSPIRSKSPRFQTNSGPGRANCRSVFLLGNQPETPSKNNPVNETKPKLFRISAPHPIDLLPWPKNPCLNPTRDR